MSKTKGAFATLLRPMDPARLSDHLGLNINTVYRWQNGRTWPRRSMLARISEATGLTVDALWKAIMADRDAEDSEAGIRHG